MKRKIRDELHKKERREFFRLLDETGERLPRGGERVLDCFLEKDGHVSPEYLEQCIRDTGEHLPVGVVNEVLDLLCRYGMAQKILLNGKGVLYEHLHVGMDHDHLLCTNCGKIVEFEDPDLDKRTLKVSEKYGFQPILHKVTILGLCPECVRGMPRQAPSMPLSLAARGERLEVVGFDGGKASRMRLMDMGLRVGDLIEIINSDGPIIVNCGGTRLALGKGLADKVRVRPSQRQN